MHLHPMEQNFTITEAPFAGYQTNPKNSRFEGFSCTFPNTAKVKVLTFNELKHIKNPPAPDFCPQPVMQVAGFFLSVYAVPY